MDEESVRVLIIEDNRDYAFLIQEYIDMARPGLFEVETVERLAAGLERLTGGGLDLILLDLSLPDSQGMDSFLTVHEYAPEVPVIVLTGLDDERVAMEAAREGAQDYLVKGQVSGDLLVRCMLSAIERHQVREKLKQYARMLEASEARFRGVIENSGDGVAIVDRGGRLRFLNQSAETMLGGDSKELLDRVLDLPPRGEIREIDLAHPGGEPSVALLRAVDTRWDGDPASMLILRDVTERMRTRKLVEAERLAAVAQVAVTVKHEINNPLSVIQGNAELLQALLDDESEGVQAKLQAIVVQVERIQVALKKLDGLRRAEVTPYDAGTLMINLEE